MKNKNLLILLIIIFISGAIFSRVSYIGLKKSKHLVKKVFDKIEQKRILSLPRAKEPLLISDFENSNDLSKWEVGKAKPELSNEHVASGKYSLKLDYHPASGASYIKLEKYFIKNNKITDWSPYEILSFDIFNPNPNKERLILQVKDKDENRFKTNLYLNPGINNHIEIDIGEVSGSVNTSRISQLNFLLWDNQSEKTFHLDNIRLLPMGVFQQLKSNIFAEQFLPKPGEKIYAAGDYFAKSKAFAEMPILLGGKVLPDNQIELPFIGGVPFARGQLYSLDKLELFDGQANSIPFQLKSVSQWPDQSIKWAFLNFKSTVSSPEKQKYYLRYSDNIKKDKFISKLILEENADEIMVNTGVLQFSLDKHNFYLFDRLWLDKNADGRFDDNELISSKVDMVLKHEGKDYHSYLDKDYTLTIEERGPIRVCLKATGWFISQERDKFCQFIVRVYAFENSSILKVQHTFIYTGYPENNYHYIYKGKRLPKNETIESIYIKTPLKIEEGSKFTFSADNKIMQASLSQTVDFLQNKFNSYSVIKNDKELLSRGNKIEGWLDLSGPSQGLTVGIKNFWEQFPKEFRIDKDNQCLITYLWPQDAGELDFKTTEASTGPDSASRGSAFGLAKTHEILFYFHKGDYQSSYVKEVMLGFLNSGSLVMAYPEWIANTKVLGKILSYDRRLIPAEEFLSRLFDWGNRQIDNFGWYGMMDFGDTLSWYRKEDDDNNYDDWGWHPVGRWGWFNCEGVGTHAGSLIQFLRTGEYKYFKFGTNLSRHIMDIDTCHYNTVANDKRLRGLIPDDYSQVGSMHRHNGNHWGDRNEEASHTNVLGLALYYYITADERARDVIDEIGDFFLKEKITYFKHPDIAPQRSVANVLWADVVIYELTGEEQYKKAADRLANLFYISQKHDGSWPENYNPVKNRWEGKPHMGYMTGYTLPALIAYHQLTGNKAIAESIVKLTDYFIKNEEYSPYFDATAYSYWLTGDKKYTENIKNKIDFIVSRQKISDDPLWNGMIYQKAYYLRLVDFLYKVPFAFAVLADEK